MIVKSRIQQRFFNALLVIATLLAATVYSITTNAQAPSYRGLHGGFAVKAVSLRNIPEIGTAVANLSGGKVGLVLGNDVLRSDISLLGYYASDRGIAGSLLLYESSASLNFFPLSLFNMRPKVEPYLTGGLAFDRLNFFGNYVNREPGNTNYSTLTLPHLGKVRELNATIGAGIEARIVDTYNFVNLFLEVKYGHNVFRSGTRAFADTETGTSMSGTAGVRFGMYR